MGSRTPILIVVIGVVGMIALGMLAQYMLESDPRVKELGAFRDALIAAFPVAEVTVRPSGQVCELRVTIDPARCVPPAESTAPLPEALVALPAFMRQHCPLQPRNQRLQISILTGAGGGCREALPVWQAEFPTERELAAVSAELAAAGAPGAVLSTPAPNELHVAIPVRGDSNRALELLPIAQKLGGGGWQRVELRFGELRFAFDAQGQRMLR